MSRRFILLIFIFATTPDYRLLSIIMNHCLQQSVRVPPGNYTQITELIHSLTKRSSEMSRLITFFKYVKYSKTRNLAAWSCSHIFRGKQDSKIGSELAWIMQLEPPTIQMPWAHQKSKAHYYLYNKNKSHTCTHEHHHKSIHSWYQA